MKYLFIILFMAGFVSASCVDINSASLSELDKITWVGPATAQKIIDARPFDSVSDLIKVSGIGEVKIEKILAEGVACVDGVVEEKNLEEEPSKVNESEEVERVVEENPERIMVKEKHLEIILGKKPQEIITLNAKDKYELVYESKNSKIMDYLPYAFSVFLIVILSILFWERV